MKRFFEKFLLGILWLLSITLITTLWMNTNYGFDMLSAAHWEYLGTLQANRSEIKPDFYISLIAALFIALIGLYLIVRPRTKRVKDITSTMPQKSNIVIVPQQPVIQPTPAPEKPKAENKSKETFSPRPAPAISLTPRPMSPMGLRPPVQRPTATIPTPPLQQMPRPVTTPQPTQNTNSPEIRTALENAEYIIKKCDRIGKLQNPTVAIAYDQSMWIIATKASPNTMVESIQTLVTIFDDTLGETANDIKLRGFIIEPTEPVQRGDDLIITFDNTADFVKYVSEHKNMKPDDYDAELFEAFSTYIGTVTGYIGKS
ncbi:MAG: hypothetical protein IJL21_03475 [Alphaproteobacteria bacterium]|nr:hypothetical protein [Alphaproteobacteria bacterium]